MRSVLACTALVAATMFLNLHCAAQTTPITRVELGLNMSSIAFYSPEVIFVDVFKQSQPWTTQAPGKGYNEGGSLSVNSRGWVEKLNGNGHLAESLMFVDVEGRYPGGDYVCLYQGDGDFEFAQAGRVISQKPGRLVVRITPANGSIVLKVTRTDPKNPVRNIRLILPGFEKSYAEEPFHPNFLKRWAGFKVIRFMDWERTNNSTIVKWSDRITPEHASQGTPGGVALEYQIKLSNTMKADPWFCIPHRADNDYVRHFAELVKATLNGERKIYLEYSNECWHPGFEQGRYCGEQGKALKLSEHDYEAQLRFYTRRSLDIFKIFEEVLGSHDRLVRIVEIPPDSIWAAGIVLDWKEAEKHLDAVAIAPYFGLGFGKRAAAEGTLRMNVDQLLDACGKEIDANEKKTREVANFVKKRGLKLLAYEGGQHLVGTEGAENNDKLTDLFQAANRHPRMKEIYLQDLKGWQSAGGGLFCVFSTTGRYSKWGSWGVLEYPDDDVKKAPKLQAVREFMGK